MNDLLFALNSQKKSTNHILHFLLCLFTGGFWVIPWIFIASSNNAHNRDIDSDINILVSNRLRGLSGAESLKRLKKSTNTRWIRDDCIFILASIVFTIALVYWLKR